MSWELAEIERLLANMVRVGVVSELDDKNARVKIKTAGLTTDWLPWTTGRAGQDRTWSAPEPGEQVLILSPYGDLGQGVVIPSIYQDAHNAPADKRDITRTVYKDGTTVEYDRQTHAMKTTITNEGSLSVTIGGASLEMSRDSIKLSCGSSSLELGDSGVKINGSRIDLN